MPVLDAIRKNGCTDTVIVVTRYFGGTLLGTGGLVRAYSSAAIGALRAANIITYDIYSQMKLTVNYSDYQKIMPILTEWDFRCEDTKFSDSVIILGKIKKSAYAAFDKDLTETTSGRCSIDFLGEKFDF